MPKLKTKSSVKKRFARTGTGKIKFKPFLQETSSSTKLPSELINCLASPPNPLDLSLWAVLLKGMAKKPGGSSRRTGSASSAAASVERPGTICMPLQTLLSLTNEMPEDARITISAKDDNKIEIKTEIGSYDIVGKPADDFPATPEIDNRKSIALDGPVLNELINKTTFAVSKDELKPALSGVLFRFEKEKTTSVATDGHRLSICSRSDFSSKGYEGSVIVPKKFLHLLSGIWNLQFLFPATT